MVVIIKIDQWFTELLIFCCTLSAISKHK